MERRWLNETRTDDQGRVTEVLPDDNGEFTLEIVNSRGNRVSTFKGHSMIEVNEKMAEAQVQANRQLGRLMKPDKGRDQPFQVTPQPISEADRLRYSTSITNPQSVVEVVEEIVTRKQGAPPAKIGQQVATFDQEAANRYYDQEAAAFMQAHPDYFPSVENRQRLFAELTRRGYDLTRNNLAIVYEALADEGQMDMGPEDEPGDEVEPQPRYYPEGGSAPAANAPMTPPIAPVRQMPAPPRPALRSSGLRGRDASAMKPPPPKPKPLVTRADLERMGRQEYEERLRDPAFRRAVDQLGQ